MSLYRHLKISILGKTEVDSSSFEEIKNEFGVPAGMGLQLLAWHFNEKRFVQDGKTGQPFIINIAAENILHSLKPFQRVYIANSICDLSVQLLARGSIVGSTASALDAEAEFVNALEFIEHAQKTMVATSRVTIPL